MREPSSFNTVCQGVKQPPPPGPTTATARNPAIRAASEGAALLTLGTLWRTRGRPPTVRELAAALGCGPSRAHALILALLADGRAVRVGKAAAPVDVAERLRAALGSDDAAA